MKKILIFSMLAVFLLASVAVGFAKSVATETIQVEYNKPVDGIQSHLSDYEYTSIVTDKPIHENVLKEMNINGWMFVSSVKHKRHYYWYFVRPTQLFLNQQ